MQFFYLLGQIFAYYLIITFLLLNFISATTSLRKIGFMEKAYL